MRSGVLTAVGVVATIAGLIWALQGFGVIGGSFMSGNSVWAIIGPVVAVVRPAAHWHRQSGEPARRPDRHARLRLYSRLSPLSDEPG